MSISSSVGLISGLNYEDIITQLTQVNSKILNLTYSKQTAVKQKQSAMQEVNKTVLSFSSAVDALKDPDAFNQVSAYSSNNATLGVSADTTASPGQYSVQVHQLAQVHRVASQGFATIDSTPIASTSGTFEYHTGDGAVVSIDVDSTTTLQDLRDRINSQDGGTVRASIVNDGTATNSYRLVLTSTSEGSENAITFGNNDTLLRLDQTTIEDAVANSKNTFNGSVTSSGAYTGTTTRNIMVEMTTAGDIGTAKYKVSLDGGLTWSANDAFTTSSSAIDLTGDAAEGVMLQFDPSATDPTGFAVGDRFTLDAFAPEIKKAQDAMIEVDGIRVTRSSNTFDDVIEGVSMEAKAVDEDPVTVKIVSDQTQVNSKIQDFVDTYNSLYDTVKKYTAYDTETQTASPLFGDSSINQILANMRAIITNRVDTKTGYQTLSDIGIAINDDGHLEIDATELGTAIQDNSSQVMRLFSESGASSSSNVKFVSSTENTRSSNYTINITTPATQASVEATSTLGTGGLAQSETLMIVDTDDNTLSITLEAGSTLSAIIDQLNSTFASRSMGLQASEKDGKLLVSTDEYGSEQTMRISSNRDASDANQLGIGKTAISAVGVDVAGTINGHAATGEGQTLKGLDNSSSEGLELLITAKSPMTSTLNFTRGIALNLAQKIEGLTDSDGGLFAVRNESYSKRIDDYNTQLEKQQDRIDAEETRLRKQFQSLESKLSELQSTGNYLTAQLASLVSTSDN